MKKSKKDKNTTKDKSLENWIWDAACSIRGVQDAPRYKDYILPLIFVKRLCDVYEDEIDRISKKVGNHSKALKLIESDKSLVRFYIPIKPDDPEKESTWSVIRTLSDKIGESPTGVEFINIGLKSPTGVGELKNIRFKQFF